MVHQECAAVPDVTQWAKIVSRGIGYGAMSGTVIGALVWLVVCLSSVLYTVITGGGWTAIDGGYEVGAVIGYALIAATVGAVVGTAVGLVAGAVFALSAPCLARRPVLAVVAGAAMPGAAFGLLTRTIGLPLLPTALMALLLVAPAGALIARPVLFGHRPSTTDPIE